MKGILPTTSSWRPAPTTNPSFWRPTRKESLWEPSPKLHPLEIQPSDFPDPPISWSSGTKIKKFPRFQSDRVGDTIDHADAILEKPAFFEQFVGKSRQDLTQSKNLEAVSGATLTSLAIVDAISLRFGGEKKGKPVSKPDST